MQRISYNQKNTAKYFKNSFNISDKNFIINQSLYDFGGKKVLETIKNLNNSLDCILIVGHNHALTSITNMIGDKIIDNINIDRLKNNPVRISKYALKEVFIAMTTNHE